MKKRCVAIVLSAGQGKRMGTSIQKQYIELCGKPIICYCLEAFEKSEIIDDVIMVAGAGQEDYVTEEIVNKYHFGKVRAVVSGGKERYDSVWNGLKAVRDGMAGEEAKEGYVYIHDGARPFVDEEIIKRAYTCVEENRACVAGMPSKDTVKIVDENQFAVTTPARKYVWNVQTPQVFETALITQAYEKLMQHDRENVTDDAMVVEQEMQIPVKKNGETVLSGKNAFKLYDTYGFPIDLTSEILEEKGLTYDEKGFEEAQKEQRAKSEGTFGTHNYSGKDASVYDELDAELSSEFVGYDQLEVESDVTAMTSETEVVDALTDGDKGTIIVAKTPFYATMGGQEADKGIICTEDGEFVVEDVVKLAGGKFGHVGQVTKGMIKVGDKVTLKVDKENRALAENNHSATHLLQKALRMVLGNHVEQAGSLNNAQRLRFDFTHFSAMTAEELQKVEDIVNEKIRENLPVVIKNMPIEEAKKTGAAALFGEKYGDIVRVVSMGDFSIEFCGGTHVKNTGNIMAFKILSETGVAAGVRRIEALTSKGLLDYYSAQEKKLHETAKLLKATPENIEEKVSHLMNENKALKGEVESLKSKLAKDAMGDVMNQVEEVKGVKFLATSLEGVDMNGLRDLGDQLKEKLGEGVILLASVNDGKVSLMATATDGAMKQGAHAGNLIKAVAKLVGGGGGGRPNMAQAGGKNPAGVEDALKAAKEALEGQLA